MEEFHPDIKIQDMWRKSLTIWGFVSFLIFVILLVVIKAKNPEVQVFPALVLIVLFEAAAVVFTLVWIPHYYTSIKYIISDDFVRIQKGAIQKRLLTIPFEKVQNVEIFQGPIERSYGLGKILIHTAGYSGLSRAEGVIKGIKDFQKLASILTEKVKQKVHSDMLEKPDSKSADVVVVLNGIRMELIEIKRLLSAKDKENDSAG